MLCLVWPVRIAIVLFGITLMIPPWPTRDRDWQLGEVVRDSLRVTEDGYTFVLARRFGESPADRPRCDRFVEVRGEGPLSPTVCTGTTVVVEGTTISRRAFVAEYVQSFNDGKYDLCWEKRCDRAAYDACRGRKIFE